MATFFGSNGNDTITPDEVSPGVVTLPQGRRPSNAADHILGGNGDDSIAAGGGRDVITGGRGDDTIEAGNGDDTILWASRDGSDSISGGAGFDTLILQGDARSGSYSIFDGFDDATVFHDRDFVFMDTNTLERIEIHGAGGGDFVQINDLSATSLDEVLVAFGPGKFDEIAFVGSGEAEALILSNTAHGGILVEGLGVTTEITGFEAARDSFIISLGEGDDTVDARDFSGANLVVATGSGNDVGVLGSGDDRWSVVGDFGNDTVDGGAGKDIFDLDASIQDDVIVVTGNGTEATASRAGSTAVLRAMERIEVESASGNDVIDGSGITTGLQLVAEGGAGADTILGGARGDVLDGGAGDDVLTGNAGRDRFAFGFANIDGRQDTDIVTDYESRDTVDLRNHGGLFTAEAVADGLLLTLTGNDGDRILLMGVGSLAEVDVLI